MAKRSEETYCKKMLANFKKSSLNDYDDFMDYYDYTMDLGVKKFEMSRILNNEPFQIMAKSLSDIAMLDILKYIMIVFF